MSETFAEAKLKLIKDVYDYLQQRKYNKSVQEYMGIILGTIAGGKQYWMISNSTGKVNNRLGVVQYLKLKPELWNQVKMFLEGKYDSINQVNISN